MKHLFSKLAVLACVFAAVAACQSDGAGRSGAIKTPETSKLFEKRVDSISGVVSYALKYGAPDDTGAPPGGIALVSWSIAFPHPVTHERMTVTTRLPL